MAIAVDRPYLISIRLCSIRERSNCMRTKLIALAFVAAFPLCAFAQGASSAAHDDELTPDGEMRPGALSPGPWPQGSVSPAALDRLDTNRDGVVSRQEARSSRDVSARFDQLDANGDGALTAYELRGNATRGSSAQRHSYY
jgi:hypothetical protein